MTGNDRKGTHAMTRITLLVAVAAAVTLGAAAHTALAATLCVGPQAGCYAQIQPAVAAAHDGDTIAVARGTYAGDVTIDKSITLQGAGATQTVISGGGPVLTIGRPVDPTAMNVSIAGVTITGGLNDSTPGDAVTFGGGVSILVAQLDHPPFNSTGATVSIANSVITGNTVTSHAVIPAGFCGPTFACGFNNGGGIANGGVLTLTNSRVTDNTSGSTPSLPSAASDVGSGGIANHFSATLVVRDSVISGNHASVNSPIANHADAGGIGSGGALDVQNSVISGNTVSYAGSATTEAQAGLAGGINVDSGCPCFPQGAATLRNVVISGNTVTASNTNPASAPSGFAGGLFTNLPLTLEHITLTDNSVQVSGAAFAGGDGGGMENDAPVTLRDSLVARNSVGAQAPLGAIAFGGGIAMFGADLTLERTTVVANTVSATSAPGPMPFGGVASASGGGISNSPPGVPPGVLTLIDSVVNANRLTGSAGLPLQGGGVYTTNGLSRTRTVIAGNKPDDCFGCATP
jgi:hypothetical protein